MKTFSKLVLVIPMIISSCDGGSGGGENPLAEELEDPLNNPEAGPEAVPEANPEDNPENEEAVDEGPIYGFLSQLGAVSIPGGGATGGNQTCKAIAVNSEKHTFCVGTTDNTFGEIMGDDTSDPDDDTFSDAYISEFDEKGKLVKVVQYGSQTRLAATSNNSDDDYFSDIAIDSNDYIYITGTTWGNLGGVANAGLSDCIVTRLKPDLSTDWVVQIAGETVPEDGDASSRETCISIAVNDTHVFVGGHTYGDLGETNGGNDVEDMFIFQVNKADGTLGWITQLGDTTEDVDGGNGARDHLYDIALSNSYVYGVGYTEGGMGEANGGAGDAVAFQLNIADGSLRWLTQTGAVTGPEGSNKSQDDRLRAAATDSAGNLFVSGSTRGNYVEGNGAGNADNDAAQTHDIFVKRYDTAGNIVWIKQVGAVTKPENQSAANEDFCDAIAIYKDQFVRCSGATTSSLAEANGGGADAFYADFSLNGELLRIVQMGSTTIADNAGAAREAVAKAGAFDSQGSFYMGGNTEGSLAEANGGSDDVFVVKFTPENQILIEPEAEE